MASRWSVGSSVSLSAFQSAAVCPSIRSSIPAPLLCAAVSHFLFSSRLWRHRGLPGVGEVVGPPRRPACSSFTTTPPFRFPPSLLKKSLDGHVNLGGVQEFGSPSLSGRIYPASVGPRCAAWDPAAGLTLPVCCRFSTLSPSVLHPSGSAALSLPPMSLLCSRGLTLPSFHGAGPVVP